MNNKCCVTLEQILNRGKGGEHYVDKKDLSLRKIAQVLDGFDESIVNTVEVIEGTQKCFMVSTKLTRTISTLRRLGVVDENIFYLLTECLKKEELLEVFGGFLMKQANVAQSFSAYYNNVVYKFHVSHLEGDVIRFEKCFNQNVRTADLYKFLEVNIYDAYAKACSYVK